jgi:hypothetical protein
MAGLELAGHRLGGAQRHQAGLLDCPARLPKCRDRRAEAAGLLELEGTRTTTRRMGQQREAEAMGRKARNTGPNAPPQRPGKGAAGARVSPCAAEVDGAVLVWCSPLPWLRPVLLTPACVVMVSMGFQRPSAPDETCTWFWGRLRPSPGGAA